MMENPILVTLVLLVLELIGELVPTYNYCLMKVLPTMIQTNETGTFIFKDENNRTQGIYTNSIATGGGDLYPTERFLE